MSKELKIKVGLIQYKELQQFMKYMNIQCWFPNHTKNNSKYIQAISSVVLNGHF